MDADPVAHEYDTLLPGEALAIKDGDPRDIEHWVTVYKELLSFKEKLLEAIGSQRGSVQSDGRLEVQHDDILFRREYARLRRRLDYWLNERETRKTND
ncbi:MAG: hypothetical protein JOY80_06845 [Candidatus Dormibacteraeota bacterium]|nr:hypothetical protein [Candidatus Dormibacteraeota bacterium]